jgi:hypothetical protein
MTDKDFSTFHTEAITVFGSESVTPLLGGQFMIKYFPLSFVNEKFPGVTFEEVEYTNEYGYTQKGILVTKKLYTTPSP